MKTTQNSSIKRRRRNVLPGKREELTARLFMGGIVAVIVAIDVLAIICAK